MGRKRTSTKVPLNLWIDEDLVDQLKKLEFNISATFTDFALEIIEKIESGEIKIKENYEIC